MIAKLGLDGHDRGAKVVATAFREFGFDVVLSPMFSSPAEIAGLVAEHRVQVLGLSSLGGGHATLLPRLQAELTQRGLKDLVVVLGGIVPPPERPLLEAQGVHVVFGPGTPLPEAAARVLDELERRLGTPPCLDSQKNLTDPDMQNPEQSTPGAKS